MEETQTFILSENKTSPWQQAIHQSFVFYFFPFNVASNNVMLDLDQCTLELLSKFGYLVNFDVCLNLLPFWPLSLFNKKKTLNKKLITLKNFNNLKF